MSDTQRPEPDKDATTLPINIVEEPDAPFTPEELRQIKIMAAAHIEARRQAEPIEVIVPAQPEPTFEGTYNRRAHWLAGAVSNIAAPILLVSTWVLAFVSGQYVLSVLHGFPEFESYIRSALSRFPKLEAYIGNTPYEEWISIWIPVILASVVSLWILWASIRPFLEWFYEKRTITETQVVLSRNVPGYIRNLLFKIDDYSEKIDRRDVKNVKFKTSGIAEFFGYATVTFETWSQTDTAFHEVRFFSHPNEVRALFPIDDLGDPDTHNT